MKNQNIFLITSFLFTLITCIFLIDKINTEVNENFANQSRSLANDISINANRVFSRSLLGVELLSEYLEFNNGSINDAEFLKISERIVNKFLYVNTVSVAKDGIISKIYPLEKNKAALGHNLIKDISRSEGAKLQISNRFLILGPVKLIQSGKHAFIFRIPYFDNEGSFAGFASVLVLKDTIEREILKDLRVPNNYRFKLTGFDPDKNRENIIFANVLEDSTLISQNIVNVLDSNWVLKVFVDKNPKYVMFFIISSCSLFLWVIFVNLYLSFNKQKKLNKKLITGAFIDSLTKIPNRRSFEEHMEKIYLKDDKSIYSLAIFDLDYFKVINDTYGHIIGDCILKEFAEICQSSLRSNDVFFRWGGEEFVLLMKGTSIKQGVDACERLRLLIESTHFVCEKGNEIKVTVSIGVTAIDKNISASDNLKKSDIALYQAKTDGRNLVRSYNY